MLVDGQKTIQDIKNGCWGSAFKDGLATLGDVADTASLAVGGAGVARGAAAKIIERAGGKSIAEDAAGLCSVNSFTADTPVLMADGTEKKISDVHVGDKVLATDPQTGLTRVRPVTALIRHAGKHTMVDITFADGSRLTATNHHPIWNVTAKTFTYAIDLKPGEQVLTDRGQALRIANLRTYQKNVTAYNLQIDGIHTYYAGSTPVLVHNTCGLPADGSVMSVDEALTRGESPGLARGTPSQFRGAEGSCQEMGRESFEWGKRTLPGSTGVAHTLTLGRSCPTLLGRDARCQAPTSTSTSRAADNAIY